jgi:hypothetical protein
MSEPKKRARVDWDAVERDYRAGKFTLRELGAKYGCDHAAIARKAKKDGWTQDLTKAVKAATKAALIQEAVTKAVNSGQQEVTKTVLAAAELNKSVILKHRGELQEARTVAMELLSELRQSAMGAQNMELLAQILAGEGADPKDEAEARKAVAKALGIGSRVSSIKALSEAITKLHDGERKAFGLDAKEGEDAPDEDDADRLRSLDKADRAALLEVIRKARGG